MLNAELGITIILHSAFCILHFHCPEKQRESMKHLFILTPAAGSKNRTNMYQVSIHEACTARNLDYRIAISEGPGDCTRIAREAA